MIRKLTGRSIRSAPTEMYLGLEAKQAPPCLDEHVFISIHDLKWISEIRLNYNLIHSKHMEIEVDTHATKQGLD